MLTRLLDAARQDARIALRRLVFDVLAGSALTPRPLRYLVYRAMGLDVRTMNVFSGTKITGKCLKIGRDTFLNHNCYLDVGRGRIEIGDGCFIGPEVMILTSTHDLRPDGSVVSTPTPHTTKIGDRVWCGARVTMLPGAVVESDCVVAAGAVVTGRCTAGGVYAGVPARRIRNTAEPTAIVSDSPGIVQVESIVDAPLAPGRTEPDDQGESVRRTSP